MLKKCAVDAENSRERESNCKKLGDEGFLDEENEDNILI